MLWECFPVWKVGFADIWGRLLSTRSFFTPLTTMAPPHSLPFPGSTADPLEGHWLREAHRLLQLVIYANLALTVQGVSVPLNF